MGTTSDVASSASGKVEDWAHGMGDQVSSAKDSASDAARTAQQTVRRGAAGSPLAAGAIAFCVGWLASSLIPASRTEERLGRAVRTTVKEQGGTVREELGSAASEVADNLRGPAKDAADQVQQTAADAASNIKDETKRHTADLADPETPARR
jgi:hypothetical protein